jgi:Predicted transcriptional regulators containing the CopG/Arc/MetJ DNA-binding domain
MKLSVSLPQNDVDFIDDYVARTELTTRSGVVQRALELLRASQLEEVYGAAWDEWSDSADASAWEAASADGPIDGPAAGQAQ